jgi:hypothetical protein
MRFTVSPEQQKFFKLQGYLELENLISHEEATRLIKSIDALRLKTPGYPEENCFRSIPYIAELVRKRGWGQLAADLLYKKPLRIAYDKFWADSPRIEQTWDKESCALLINFSSHLGTFFKKPPETFKPPKDAEGFLFLIFTANHLPEELNPTVIR